VTDFYESFEDTDASSDEYVYDENKKLKSKKQISSLKANLNKHKISSNKLRQRKIKVNNKDKLDKILNKKQLKKLTHK
jgi:hypothetical protein